MSRANALQAPGAGPEPHDAHVEAARKVFRDCGFTLASMQFRRSPDAIAALRTFNRVPDNWRHPFAWNYHPNAWCRDLWLATGRLV